MKITSLAAGALAAGIVLAVTALGATTAVADTGPGEVVAADTAAPPVPAGDGPHGGRRRQRHCRPDCHGRRRPEGDGQRRRVSDHAP